MAVMAHHANVIAPDIGTRTAEGFNDRRISYATGSPKTQAVENYIHTVRVAGIDDCAFRVRGATTELGGKF
jgi:hypothetical protein